MNYDLRLHRREFMVASAASALAASIKPQPVSYLVILADQLTWWMCDPAQRGALELPNIDRLRAQSTEFESCYSTSPWCPSARLTLRDGIFPHANPGGYVLHQSAETVERRLRGEGLATRYLGKWHLSPKPAPSEYVAPADRVDWDLFVGHEKDHKSLVTYAMNDPTPISTAPWDPDVMTNYALEMMREDVAEERPFFMQVNYLPPHQPYHKYPKHLGVYTQGDVVLRPNVSSSQSSDRITQAHYMNLVRGVDIEIGRLLDELDELESEVVVIFTSDHGDMLASQGETFKRKPWEESARVPLMIRGPGWEAGKRVCYPVGLIDLAQTLAGLGQGIDLRERRDSVYFEMDASVLFPFKNWTGGGWRALVTDDQWKLAIAGNGQRLLYHLREDPYELEDLAQQGLEQEAALETRMREWAEQTQDGFFMS